MKSYKGITIMWVEDSVDIGDILVSKTEKIGLLVIVDTEIFPISFNYVKKASENKP